MSRPVERAPLTAEIAFLLMVGILALLFWGSYVGMIVLGEIPEMLGY